MGYLDTTGSPGLHKVGRFLRRGRPGTPAGRPKLYPCTTSGAEPLSLICRLAPTKDSGVIAARTSPRRPSEQAALQEPTKWNVM